MTKVVTYFWQSTFLGASFGKLVIASRNDDTRESNLKYELNCSWENSTTSTRQTCPINYPKMVNMNYKLRGGGECPEYFRWIYQDLKPWVKTGITKEMVESGIPKANMRFIILDGKLYVQKYSDVFQTRDVFTIWGILQLLQFYPNKLPDVDFMFDLGDMPRISKRHYLGVNASIPPPVFHYCADFTSLDILFPDWSLWGWYVCYYHIDVVCTNIYACTVHLFLILRTSSNVF